MSDLLNLYDRMARDDDDGFVPFVSASLNVLEKADGSGGARKQLDIAIRDVPEVLQNRTVEHFERCLVRCESPIERRLLPWLLCQKYANYPHAPFGLLPGESSKLPPYAVGVVPQLPIGRHRVDFALAVHRGGPIRFVIVECDGAKYHKDLQRDLARDAELLRYRQVIGVRAIAGGDILRDPKSAARLAAQALSEAWAKDNFQQRGKFT